MIKCCSKRIKKAQKHSEKNEVLPRHLFCKILNESSPNITKDDLLLIAEKYTVQNTNNVKFKDFIKDAVKWFSK